MTEYLDRYRGAFAGLFIGDTLGAPHEFRNHNRLDKYTGIIQFETIVQTRFQGSRTIPMGQYTDDTEMTLVLMRSIREQQGYNPKDIIFKYSLWATSGIISIGTNTSDLFKQSKAKTLDKRIQTYSTHYKNKFKSNPVFTANEVSNITKLDDGKFTQSNGSMMRCLPLALFNSYDPILVDCALTNPTLTNIYVNMIYLDMIRLNLLGFSKQTINQIITNRYSHVTDIIQIYNQSIIDKLEIKRDIKDKKGWCLHAFYLAIKAYYFFESYQDTMDFVIRCGGDTDTNAAIAGALLGSYLGWNRMQQEERTIYNYHMIMNTPKREGYDINDWLELTEQLCTNRNYLKMI